MLKIVQVYYSEHKCNVKRQVKRIGANEHSNSLSILSTRGSSIMYMSSGLQAADSSRFQLQRSDAGVRLYTETSSVSVCNFWNSDPSWQSQVPFVGQTPLWSTDTSLRAWFTCYAPSTIILSRINYASKRQFQLYFQKITQIKIYRADFDIFRR